MTSLNHIPINVVYLEDYVRRTQKKAPDAQSYAYMSQRQRCSGTSYVPIPSGQARCRASMLVDFVIPFCVYHEFERNPVKVGYRNVPSANIPGRQRSGMDRTSRFISFPAGRGWSAQAPASCQHAGAWRIQRGRKSRAGHFVRMLER